MSDSSHCSVVDKESQPLPKRDKLFLRRSVIFTLTFSSPVPCFEVSFPEVSSFHAPSSGSLVRAQSELYLDIHHEFLHVRCSLVFLVQNSILASSLSSGLLIRE